jgi:hypothetical protein
MMERGREGLLKYCQQFQSAEIIFFSVRKTTAAAQAATCAHLLMVGVEQLLVVLLLLAVEDEGQDVGVGEDPAEAITAHGGARLFFGLIGVWLNNEQRLAQTILGGVNEVLRPDFPTIPPP